MEFSSGPILLIASTFSIRNMLFDVISSKLSGIDPKNNKNKLCKSTFNAPHTFCVKIVRIEKEFFNELSMEFFFYLRKDLQSLFQKSTHII